MRASSALRRSGRVRVTVSVGPSRSQPHPRTLVDVGAGRVPGPPRGELRPGLQDRVDRRFGHQALVDRASRLASQEQGEGHRRDGERLEVLLDCGQ